MILCACRCGGREDALWLRRMGVVEASISPAALAARPPLLPGADPLTYVDVDSLLRRVYGPAKQGASFGHAKVGGYRVKLRGLSPLLAAISTDQAAPVIA